MKTKLLAVLVSTCLPVMAADYPIKQYSYGSGSHKGDALASALSRVNYGNTIKHIQINGSSTKKCIPGIGYIQTSGNYKCRVISQKSK